MKVVMCIVVVMRRAVYLADVENLAGSGHLRQISVHGRAADRRMLLGNALIYLLGVCVAIQLGQRIVNQLFR